MLIERTMDEVGESHSQPNLRDSNPDDNLDVRVAVNLGKDSLFPSPRDKEASIESTLPLRRVSVKKSEN